MRCDYSGGIRIDRVAKLDSPGKFVPVVADQDAGGHGSGNGSPEGIPGIDVTIRLAVVGRVTANVAILPRAAHVFGGQGFRLARLGMCVPFTENLGAPRDQGRCFCGIGRARTGSAAAPSLDYGTANASVVEKNESEILVGLRTRSIECELLAHMRIHHVLRTFGSACDPVVTIFPRLGGRDDCQQDANYSAPPPEMRHA